MRGVFILSKAHAVGPSLGISASGEVAADGKGDARFSGSLAPLYQINSLLGRAPLIGGLFVSRRGEGVVAISYEIEGPVSQPRVTINPLSALTPGVLRRAFEGNRNGVAGEPSREDSENVPSRQEIPIPALPLPNPPPDPVRPQ